MPHAPPRFAPRPPPRRTPLSLVLALLLPACSSAPKPPPVPAITAVEVATAAAKLLCEAAEQGGLSCTAEAGVATLERHRLDLSAAVTNFRAVDPQSLGLGSAAQGLPGEVQLAVEISLSVDGAKLFTGTESQTASDVDLLSARAAALDGLLQRWVLARGLPTLDALAVDPKAPSLVAVGMKVPAQELGALRAWAGYPILRGQGFDPKAASRLAPALRSMLAALGPYTSGLDLARLHTLRIKAKLGGGGAPGPCGILPPIAIGSGSTVSIVPLHGEVLVDGQPSGDICSLSEPVAWPLPPKGALVEWDQFVVLTAASP